MLKKVNYRDYDNQRAIGYIIYMMAGSLFHRCVCSNRIAEQSNYLHFVEMPQRKEETIEDSVLKALDDLDLEFLESVNDLDCEVSFSETGGLYRIFFRTGGFEELEAVVEPSGRFAIKAIAA